MVEELSPEDAIEVVELEEIGPAVECVGDGNVTIAIPGGAQSCAIGVVGTYTGTSPATSSVATDSSKILGLPDKDGGDNTYYYSLGANGSIVLEFGVWITDGEGDDICVFELGPAAEPTKVYLSNDYLDGESWVYVGDTAGLASGVDISSYVEEGAKFKYVKLVDRDGKTGTTAGADIAAVAVLHPVGFPKKAVVEEPLEVTP